MQAPLTVLQGDCATAARLTRARAGAGVYVGCMYYEYVGAQAAAGAPLPPQAFIGSGAPYLVGRLSYTFGLTGERHIF
jgi:acyl transferase domain-containing protein